MSYTKEVVVENDDWTAITPAGRSAFIQIQGSNSLNVVVASAKPDVSFKGGIVLSSSGLQELAIEDLEAGDLIYARCNFPESGDGRTQSSYFCAIISGTNPEEAQEPEEA